MVIVPTAIEARIMNPLLQGEYKNKEIGQSHSFAIILLAVWLAHILYI
jgi:hypothetical protein